MTLQRTPPPRLSYEPGDPVPEGVFSGSCALFVLLGARGVDPAWAARSAVSLAARWAETGGRVFLGDLELGLPRLHQELGQVNGEGMTDVFLYGASLRRIARPSGDGFFFASAGTPVADPRRVLRSPRWDLLVKGFTKAGAHLLVYLPVEAPGARELLARAERVMVLSPSPEADLGRQADVASDRIVGVLSPSGRSRTEAGGRRAAPVVFPAPGEAAAPKGPSRGKTYGKPKPVRKKTAPWLVALVGLGLVLGVVALLIALDMLPGPWSRSTGAPAPTLVGGGAPQTTPPAAPSPNYFLTLGSYSEGAIALLQAEPLGERRPDLLFVVSPVEVNGEVLYRLMAGVTDDSAATQLRESLGRTLTQEDPAGWTVRPGPLSYHLGSFATRDEATLRTEELHQLDVPAYLLSPAGEPVGRYDVWAGAYADSSEAAYLGRTLTAHGIVPVLTRRAGDPVPE